jgi:pilus assembly protein CpaE
MAPTSLRTVVVDSDPESRALLRGLLATNRSTVIVAEFADIAEALVEVNVRRPDLMIVELPHRGDAVEFERSTQLVTELSEALPDTAIFATAPSVSADFVIRVIRAGAVEFLSRPIERADVTAAIEKLGRFRRGSPREAHSGRITSVFAAKGGLGVTTVATNLSVCLAGAKPGKVLLVDLDSRQSDITTFLNLRPTYSVIDAFENVGRMDESFLRGLLTKHDGLWVLPGPSRMERIQLGAEPVRVGLDIMRTYFDDLVLDLRHDLDPGTVAALEASDTVLFLTGPDVASVRSSGAALAAFRQLGLTMDKVRLVLMRDETGEDVTIKQVREALAIPVFWKIPNDYATAVSSINAGKPFLTAAPRSRLARSIQQLGDWLAQTPERKSAKDKTSFSLKRLMWSPKGSPGA